jgi:hypothetical protein
MKSTFILVSSVFLAACAGQPEQPARTRTAAVTATPAPATVPTDPTLTPERIHELRREGYVMTVKSGTTYFCREEVKVGTHLSRPDTICLTSQQIESDRENTQQNFGAAAREAGQLHPTGN